MQNQDTTKQELRAEEIHTITQGVLSEHFAIDMSDSQYEQADIFDVLIGAAVEQITIEMASELLTDAPSANTVRTRVKAMLADDEALSELEQRVNAMLVSRLSKSLLKSKLPGALDLTEIPYHGEHEADDEFVRRGKAKQGTSHFHCYGTLYVVKRHQRYTLAIVLVRRQEQMAAVIKRLLGCGEALDLRLKRLYLDRGFDNNGVVELLKTKPFATILPLVHRGRKGGGTHRLLIGRKSYRTTYERRSTVYGTQQLPLIIVCKYSKGCYQRQGLCRFAYVLIGALKMSPDQVYQEYRCRFAIETSYRLMNTVRARTSTKTVHLRLFWTAFALLLLNLWAYVKWTFLFVPQPGPRQVHHRLLPLAPGCFGFGRSSSSALALLYPFPFLLPHPLRSTDSSNRPEGKNPPKVA